MFHYDNGRTVQVCSYHRQPFEGSKRICICEQYLVSMSITEYKESVSEYIIVLHVFNVWLLYLAGLWGKYLYSNVTFWHCLSLVRSVLHLFVCNFEQFSVCRSDIAVTETFTLVPLVIYVFEQ